MFTRYTIEIIPTSNNFEYTVRRENKISYSTKFLVCGCGVYPEPIPHYNCTTKCIISILGTYIGIDTTSLFVHVDDCQFVGLKNIILQDHEIEEIVLDHITDNIKYNLISKDVIRSISTRCAQISESE